MKHLAPLFALACLTACSSGYSSGVDGSKPFSSITVDEAQTACLNLAQYFRDSFTDQQSIEVQCYGMALADPSSTVEQCEAAFAACMADPPEPNRTTIDCSDPMITTDCNATVSQVESCLTGFVNTSLDRIDAINCSIAGNVPELQRLQGPLPPTSECVAIEPVCPDVPGT